YKTLITSAVIYSTSIQNVNPGVVYGTASQPIFSPDGLKFVYSTGYGGPNGWHDVRILNFDRCTGDLFNFHYIPSMPGVGFGLAFSSNSNYLYHSFFQTIFQVDMTTLAQDTVALNEGFYSPYAPLQTDFWLMYL